MALISVGRILGGMRCRRYNCMWNAANAAATTAEMTFFD